MMKIGLLFILLCCLVCWGCSANKETGESDLVYAYRLIDDHRADEAIEYLTEVIKTNSDPEYKVALASAYAARANVNIHTLAPFIFSLKRAEEVTKPSVGGSKLYKSSEVLKAAGEFLDFQRSYLATLGSVPDISDAQEMDIKIAITLLRSVKDDSRLALYRAILRLLLFKKLTLSVSNKQIMDFEKVVPTNCSFKLEVFRDYSIQVERHLYAIFNDAAIAYPSRKAEYRAQQEKLIQYTQALVSTDHLKMPEDGTTWEAIVASIILNEHLLPFLQCQTPK